jgi:hypothetical protein
MFCGDWHLLMRTLAPLGTSLLTRLTRWQWPLPGEFIYCRNTVSKCLYFHKGTIQFLKLYLCLLDRGFLIPRFILLDTLMGFFLTF